MKQTGRMVVVGCNSAALVMTVLSYFFWPPLLVGPVLLLLAVAQLLTPFVVPTLDDNFVSTDTLRHIHAADGTPFIGMPRQPS